MNRKDLYNGFNEVDDDILERSETASKSKKKPTWLKWGAIAACLCLVVSIAIPVLFHQSPDTPHDTMDPSDGPSSLVVNGTSYLISPHLAVSDDLPDGFVHAGEASVGGFENCPYYTNPDMPEWVYVYHEVSTDGNVDATGTLNRTEPHNAYVRYVYERLRGKDLVCYNVECAGLWQHPGCQPRILRQDGKHLWYSDRGRASGRICFCRYRRVLRQRHDPTWCVGQQ